MGKLKFKNMSNSDLQVLRKKKSDEFSKVKMDIVNLYDYWLKIEGDYNEITEELNKRNVRL
jgi:hypothetical protein